MSTPESMVVNKWLFLIIVFIGILVVYFYEFRGINQFILNDNKILIGPEQENSKMDSLPPPDNNVDNVQNNFETNLNTAALFEGQWMLTKYYSNCKKEKDLKIEYVPIEFKVSVLGKEIQVSGEGSLTGIKTTKICELTALENEVSFQFTSESIEKDFIIFKTETIRKSSNAINKEQGVMSFRLVNDTLRGVFTGKYCYLEYKLTPGNVEVIAEDVNLRSSPSELINTNKLGKLIKGERGKLLMVSCFDTEGKYKGYWFYVDFNGKKGWVARKFINRI